VATVFNAAHSGHSVGAALAWQGALAFTIQLYFDFSGYSDMAVGLSRLFGIRLPFNFASPYQATGIIEFWRRWHMTLSRFLRDYLYFPLGGNRKGGVRRYANLMLTMLLGGLWHGANWTFVVWGGLHGLYLVVNHAWRAVRPAGLLDPIPALLRRLPAVALTFVAVIIAWVLFRAPDFRTAARLFADMAGLHGFSAPPGTAAIAQPGTLLDPLGGIGLHHLVLVLRYAGALFIIFALPNTQRIIEGVRFPLELTPARVRFFGFRPGVAWGAALGAIAALTVMTFTQLSEFLYFQF